MRHPKIDCVRECEWPNKKNIAAAMLLVHSHVNKLIALMRVGFFFFGNCTELGELILNSSKT